MACQGDTICRVLLLLLLQALLVRAFDKRKKAVVVIEILSGPENYERRERVRQTWLRWKTSDVAYKFLTDATNDSRQQIENDQYGDLFVLNDTQTRKNLWTHGGSMRHHVRDTLSYKIYQFMKYAEENYDYLYFIHMNDDVFLCLETLLQDFETRQRHSLYWGWFHCKGVIRADGQVIILTRDVVQQLTSSVLTLKFQFADGLQIGQWLEPYNLTKFNDPRMIVDSLKPFTANFCNEYLSWHNPLVTFGRIFDAVTQTTFSPKTQPIPDTVCDRRS